MAAIAAPTQPSITLSQSPMLSRFGGGSLNSSSIAPQLSTSRRRNSVRSSDTSFACCERLEHGVELLATFEQPREFLGAHASVGGDHAIDVGDVSLHVTQVCLGVIRVVQCRREERRYSGQPFSRACAAARCAVRQRSSCASIPPRTAVISRSRSAMARGRSVRRISSAVADDAAGRLRDLVA